MKYLVKIFGLCFLISGIVILVHSYNSWSEKNKIISEGETTLGTVIGYVKAPIDAGSIPVYVYTFEYYVDSTRYLITNEYNSSSPDYYKGDKYNIIYKKDNPNNAVIMSKNETVNLKLMEILLFSTFIIVGLLILLINHKKVVQIFKNN